VGTTNARSAALDLAFDVVRVERTLLSVALDVERLRIRVCLQAYRNPPPRVEERRFSAAISRNKEEPAPEGRPRIAQDEVLGKPEKQEPSPVRDD
jgi:hypothetical protein